ncbi:hypothetical protein F3H09_31975, partial [Pseudomonas aeruginosa]
EVDRRSAVDAVYTDFSKAFDRVNHRILLQKLSDNGIAEPLLSWCSSYLSTRQSMVVASGFFLTLSRHPLACHRDPISVLYFLIYL